MKLFGKYEVLEEVGTGAIGSRVFRTRDRILQREALVKAFSIEGMTAAAKQRFFREAQAAAHLEHPNIVSIYDVAEQDEFAYIAMEQLEGENIQSFIHRQPTLPLEAKLRFMVEICEGFAYAHENGVIHRDITPANILILKSGRPKILDFAIVRAFTSKSLPAGTVVGTPEYMSPEQFRNLRGDARSDIFSISIVFFELLTNKYPFPRKDIANEIQADPAPLITEVNPMLPRRLALLLAKGLAKDPAARIQTAGEFVTELKAIAAEIPHLSADLAKDVAGLGEKIRQLQSRIQDDAPDVRERLAQVDVSILDRLTPAFTAAIASELDYFSIVEFQKQAVSTLNNLERIVLESKPVETSVAPPPEPPPVAAKAAAAATSPSPKAMAPAGQAPAAPAAPKILPTVDEKLSELTLATKIGDVHDILAITDEINHFKKEWFGENPDNESGLESVQRACRKALDAVVEISQSRIHSAISRGDVNAAQEEFHNVEQVCQKDAHYTELAGQINKQIQDFIARQDQPNQPKRRLPSSDARPSQRTCPSCGKLNSDSAVLCESCGARLPVAGRRVPRVVVTKESQKKSSPSKFVVPGVIVVVVAVIAFVFVRRGDSTVNLGTAQIAKTVLLRPQKDSDEHTTELSEGKEVEFVKEIPDMKPEAWAEVQVKDVGRGFVKNSDLKHVNSKNCTFNLWHVSLLLNNMQNLAVNDLKNRADQVKTAMDACPAKDASDGLRMSLAEAYGQLATTLGHDAGQPQVTQANLQLGAIGNKAPYSKRIEAVQTEIAALTPGTTDSSKTDSKENEKKVIKDTYDPTKDDFQRSYVDAKTVLDSAKPTDPDLSNKLTSAIKGLDKIIHARFNEKFGKDLQTSAKALRQSAIETLCIADQRNALCNGK